MLNGSAAPAKRPRRGRPRAKAAPAPSDAAFDAETLAVADPAPTPVQLKDLATAARTAQAVGRAALGADADDAPGAAARAIAGLLGEIDGGTRGLPDGG